MHLIFICQDNFTMIMKESSVCIIWVGKGYYNFIIHVDVYVIKIYQHFPNQTVFLNE